MNAAKGKRFHARGLTLQVAPRRTSPVPTALKAGLPANSAASDISMMAPSGQGEVQGDVPATPPRFGFTVTKQCGGAVQRNRIRRRLKEAVRLLKPLPARPANDYVILARPEALGMSFLALQAEISRALGKIDTRKNLPPTRHDRDPKDPSPAVPNDAWQRDKRQDTQGMTKETKNLILAICLSMLVVLGWETYYEKDRQIQAQKQAQLAQTPGAQTPWGSGHHLASPNPPVAGSSLTKPGGNGAEKTRAEALAESSESEARHPGALWIDLRCKGARLDDVSFKAYRETIDPNSPHIILLSPAGCAGALLRRGRLPRRPGRKRGAPGADTVWQADRDTLTETSPVTLTYDNGQGLVFHRQIAVDDRYMFTLTDSVENKSAQAVSLHPYARVARHGKPVSANYSILHEGFVGVIGDSGVQQIKYDKIEKEDRGTKVFTGTGGWLGLTDKYWGAAGHSGPVRSLSRRALTRLPGPTSVYQSGFVARKSENARAGRFERIVTTRVFAGAKETDTLEKYQANLGIEKFDLSDRLGLVLFHHQADVLAARL